VSYAEIVATHRQASMIYGPEAPCQCVMSKGRVHGGAS
jgi:hypothetical protein